MTRRECRWETMQGLARYWASDYDWGKCEARLNALPNFITEIDGLDIHFIHVRSQHEDALPLIGSAGAVISPPGNSRNSPQTRCARRSDRSATRKPRASDHHASQAARRRCADHMRRLPPRRVALDRGRPCQRRLSAG